MWERSASGNDDLCESGTPGTRHTPAVSRRPGEASMGSAARSSTDTAFIEVLNGGGTRDLP